MLPQADSAKPRRRRRRKPVLRKRLERSLKWLEPLGMGVPGSGFFFTWWKRLGLNWAIALCVTFLIPVSQFSLLNFAMKNGVPYMIGDFGVTFTADDWDLHLLGLRGTAHNVRIARDARSAPVLTADEMEFNATLGTLLGRLLGRPQIFDEIIVRDGDIRIEQSLGGELNWAKFVETVPADRRRAVSLGQYQTRALVFDRVRIEYVEHIPSASGGGVIQTTQARVYADDVKGSFGGVVVPSSSADLPTSFELEGRSSDGIVQVSGRAAFFPPGAGAEGVAGLDVKVYLENVGMGAYGKTVSTTSLMPVRGTLRGTVNVTRAEGRVNCRSTLIADDVEFAPNPRVVLARAQYDRLAYDLRGYRASGPFDPCGTGAEDPSQTASGVLASFNTQTTLTAPASVRLVAARDEQNFGRSVGSSVAADISGRLAREAGRRANALVGESTGETVQQQGGNALSKGARSVGRGFKKLFGK
jgi:hypothetical protein